MPAQWGSALLKNGGQSTATNWMRSNRYHQLHPPRFLPGCNVNPPKCHDLEAAASVWTERSRKRLPQALSPTEVNAADRHCNGGLGRLDNRYLDSVFKLGPIAGHAGTAH